MQLNFHSYSKIENHYSKSAKGLIQREERKQTSSYYLATEKVHGTNVCFIAFRGGPQDHAAEFFYLYTCERDGCPITVVLARRNDFITKKCNFFAGASDIFEAYKDKIADMCAEVTSPDSEATFRVFGELYGGLMLGESNPKGPIQTEIEYSLDYRFYPFDIMLEDKTLAMHEMLSLLHKYRMPCPAIFSVGPLHSMLKLDEVVSEMLSTVSDKKDEPIEGLIIRNISGSLRIKIKSSMFMDRVKNPFSKIPKKQFQSLLDAALEEAKTYITEHRIQSVRAKSCQEGFRLASAVARDICDEEDFDHFLKQSYGFRNKQIKAVRKMLTNEVHSMMQENGMAEDESK